jgi:hypothetical protein
MTSGHQRFSNRMREVDRFNGKVKELLAALVTGAAMLALAQ